MNEPVPRTGRRIARLLAPHRPVACLVVLLVAVFSGLHVALPLLARLVFDHALFGAGGTDLRLLAQVALLAAVIAAAAAAVDLAQSWLATRVAERIVHTLRSDLFRHLQRMPLGFFAASRGGEIQSRLVNDTDRIEETVKDGVPTALASLLMLLFALGAMITLSPPLAAVALGLMPVAFWIAARSGRAMRELASTGQHVRAELASISAERLSLGGVTLARVHDRAGDDAASFAAESRRLAGLGVRSGLVAQSVLSAGQLLVVLTPYVVYVAAGLTESVTPGALVAFAVLQARVYQPLWQILHFVTGFQTARAAFERVFHYLDLPAARAATVPGGSERGRVSVLGAGVAHGPSHWALREVTIDLPAGSATLIAGPSGSGKTTLGRLLAALYPPSEGAVLAGGRVCLVPQEPFLFHGSIADNLRYAAPDASPADLVRACEITRVHRRVTELPDGYDSVVGERGALLSGGERQRIALARGLLSGAPVLVLDEATSALDSPTELEVIRAVLRARRGMTTVMISHRLDVARSFDTVVVLDGGRVVEHGPRTELLARPGGRFARLAALT
ncbi:ABC transporter ATP-binding protein [Nonomuraea sp. LPB2021202275-12-8]|uniref:ABC transporter ATP-binding protein n=1 Tax=Nonomuraea sp. LPB2021202275-12-8 TaxID=3120159 RepID=UPI00300D6F64